MSWAFALAVALAGSVGEQGVTVTALRCEWARDPLGLDLPRPRLSWALESPRRGTMQKAYRVLVASSEGALASDRGDLWDSGRVESNRSIEVPYAGRALRPGQRAHWKVHIWNQDDQPSAWSAPAWWERSVDPQEWTARWIALPDATRYPDALALAEVEWIGNPLPEAAPNAQDDIRLFRREVQLPADRGVRAARLLAAADDRFMLRLNGEWIAAGRGVGLIDLTDDLVTGANELGFTVSNATAPAALAARLVVEFETGEPLVVSTDTGWQTARQDIAGRTAGTFASASWASARTLGPFGEGFRGDRWFKQAEALARPPRSAPAYLRKSLRLSKPVKSARAYATALGVYELRMNGRRVGEDVLAPGWTDYTKRVQYQTYDVTPLVAQGQNTIGIILGDGWYAGRIGWKGERAHYGPLPMARVELRVEYQDGTTEAFGTDATWTGARGPILYSDLLEGESYDARSERSGWDTNRFVETGWTAASEPPAPSIATVAEVGPPVRRMEELRPKSWAEPAPGKIVFDLGQNMVGWLRLEVKGPAGARVRMRFAEILNPDGTLYTVNLRSARSTDTYVLKGAPGGETFEPRFTFHGFRYVELVGYPGRPGPDAITGIVVRSAIKATGSLETSNATVNQLQHNIEWGQRGNFLSVPTDCPQRDERLGWMGDAQIFARTACFNGDVA
ncbi:MAG TPA: family 78 glycoside hydrolase catalytic domain, partial [Vicinamibacteria bacterium]|nr:family 78 glycoside hydrolase catalytic domain [Vicinamibacteria bacterium]